MVWLEIRVSQRSPFTARDAAELSTIIEDTLDLPPRRVYCEPQGEFSWCYAEIEELPRLGVHSLCTHRRELGKAFDERPHRQLDAVGVIEASEVGRLVPEAVQEAIVPAGAEEADDGS